MGDLRIGSMKKGGSVTNEDLVPRGKTSDPKYGPVCDVMDITNVHEVER